MKCAKADMFDVLTNHARFRFIIPDFHDIHLYNSLLKNQYTMTALVRNSYSFFNQLLLHRYAQCVECEAEQCENSMYYIKLLPFVELMTGCTGTTRLLFSVLSI